ncbi:zf-HC2 domain-containing protein [Oceanobacillus caeni]|uniref:zf-HC2 domain-containing protein n=1 Tax=Oceanobacillus caeni TaxID=405946 RepID=UPI002E1A7B53|nr:zf-HC2 domain-containing protein [Oceanobacillus caeni]
MKEIKCTIIQDVLPPYIDEVVSQDTKEMVDQHLQHCEKCQKEYETMKVNCIFQQKIKLLLLKRLIKNGVGKR